MQFSLFCYLLHQCVMKRATFSSHFPKYTRGVKLPWSVSKTLSLYWRFFSFTFWMQHWRSALLRYWFAFGSNTLTSNWARPPPSPPTATGRQNLGYPLGYSCKKMYWKESEVRNTHKAVIFNEKQRKIEQHVSTRTRPLSGTLIAEPGTCLEQCLDTFWNPVDPLPPVTIHVCLKFDHFLPDSPPPSTGCHKCMAPYWSVKTFEYLPPKKHRKSQREYQ